MHFLRMAFLVILICVFSLCNGYGYEKYISRLRQNPNMSPMYYEGNRLSSFDRAPIYDSFFSRLASLGFYYIEEINTTECAFCRAEYNDGNNPEDIHHRECPLEHENIPIRYTDQGESQIQAEPYNLMQQIRRSNVSDTTLQTRSQLHETFPKQLFLSPFVDEQQNSRPPTEQNASYILLRQDIDEQELIPSGRELYAVVMVRYIQEGNDENFPQRQRNSVCSSNLRQLNCNRWTEEDSQNMDDDNYKRACSKTSFGAKSRTTVKTKRQTRTRTDDTAQMTQTYPTGQRHMLARKHRITESELHSRPRQSYILQQALRSKSEVKQVTRPPAADTEHPVFEGERRRLVNKNIDVHNVLAVQAGTFQDKPNSSDQITNFYSTGYFYQAIDDDVVRCFTCDLLLAEWDSQDDPAVKCVRCNKNSDFLKRNYNPRHRDLDDRYSRLDTFVDHWRTDMKKSAERLSDAGFFYSGERDIVRCFYCDGGLRHWESGDDPWEEHARWFPFCKFVIKMKGRNYIDMIRMKQETKRTTGEISSRKESRFKSESERDIVRCFYCDGGLRHWESGDDPWEDHARKYVISREGIKFIDRIRRDFETKRTTGEISSRKESRFKSEKIKRLRDENKKMKSSYICVICMRQRRSITFMPCGHIVACVICVYKTKIRKCRVCGKKITEFVRVLL